MVPKTSSSLRFDNSDKGRDALLALVRRKISIGPLLMSDTVLALQSDPQGGYWLWTVTPWVVTLEQDLVGHITEPSRLENSLLKYAGALLTGLRYALRRDVLLSLDPASVLRATSLFWDEPGASDRAAIVGAGECGVQVTCWNILNKATHRNKGSTRQIANTNRPSPTMAMSTGRRPACPPTACSLSSSRFLRLDL